MFYSYQKTVLASCAPSIYILDLYFQKQTLFDSFTLFFPIKLNMLWQEDCNHLKVDIDNYYKNMRDQFIIFLIDTWYTYTHACNKSMYEEHDF